MIEIFDQEELTAIKRMCDIILNSKSMDKELDALALQIGHHSEIINANNKVKK